MEKTYFDHALEIVKSKAAALTTDEIVAETQALATKLEAAANGTAAPAEGTVKLIPGFDAAHSVKKTRVISGLDGKEYKILGTGHFKKFGTTREAYLDACGLPRTTRLVCDDLAAFRKAKMADMRLWERKKNAKSAAPAEAY